MATDVALRCFTGSLDGIRTELSDLLGKYHLQTESEKGTPVSTVQQLPARYRREVEDPDTSFSGATVILADVDGVAVGCAVLTGPHGGACELKRVWTDPDFRGRGVASRVIEAALVHADVAGADTVRLSVWTWRREAIALYRRFGFTEVESWDDRDDLICMQWATSPWFSSTSP